MSDLSINTAAGAYTTAQTQWSNLKSALQPRLAIFVRLTRPEQRAWLQRDPLLRDILQTMQAVSDALEAAT